MSCVWKDTFLPWHPYEGVPVRLFGAARFPRVANPPTSPKGLARLVAFGHALR